MLFKYMTTKMWIFICAFVLSGVANAEQLRSKTQRFLRDLVEINSGTENIAGQQAVRELIKNEFAQYGLPASEIEVPGAQNTIRKILVFKTHDSSNEIVLLGHTDTVFSPSSPPQPFTMKNGKIYGPGVIDMKGGIALIGDILSQLNDSERKRIQVIFNDDEETGSIASREKLRELTNSAKAVLVFEPGLPDGSVVVSHGGIASYILDVKGKAAHAGLEPEKGFSACIELSYKMIEAANLSDLVSRININPGVIEGGMKSNIVCEHASAKLDVRFQTPEQFVDVEKSLNKIAENVYSKRIPADFLPSATLTRVNKRPPFLEEKSARLFSIFSNVAQNLSLTARGRYVGYVTDASSISSNNADILVGLGPYGGGMHTTEEFLSIKRYGERLRLDTAFIKELLKQPY